MHVVDETPLEEKPAGPSRRVTLALVGGACALFVALFFRMIHRNAVNILFWDQFDFLTGLREHASLWKLFSWTHGPHRMGLGYLFIDGVYGVSHWDTRFEAFATGGLSLMTLALLLRLKTSAIGPLTVFDVALPAFILSPTQYEIFVGTPNAAHGPIPLLLVVLAPFCWMVRSAPLRVALASLLAFCAAFTGFAMFLVPCLVAMFAADALWPPIDPVGGRAWALAGAVLCAAAIPLFLIDYHFGSAVACYQFPHPRPLDYIPFAGLIVLRPMGLGHLVPGATLYGIAGCIFVVALAARGAFQAIRRNRTLRSRTVFLFSAFSLAFVAATTVGRICLGMGQAFASRYVPYLLPLWLAAYFVLAESVSKRPSLRRPAAAVVAVLVVLQLVPKERAGVRWFSEGKRRWRSCYLERKDESTCDRVTGFRVYPVAGAPQVKEMLSYLREHHLNLFK